MHPLFREEEDLIGTRQINDACYYGIHTLRAVENFRISKSRISDFPEFIKGMVAVKKAAARANNRLGTLSVNICEAITTSCDRILKEGHYIDQFPVDVFQGGAGTSLNMNVNEVIANVALEIMGYAKGRYDVINPNDHVNMSQSTNDAYPTGFRLAVYREIQLMLTALDDLKHACEAKGKEFSHILKMGRTQLQDAVPMTLGLEFRAFGTALKEEKKTINYAAGLLLEVNLGATAIGTGVNTHEHYQSVVLEELRHVTGLPVMPSEDLIEATSDCGAYVLLQSTLKRLAIKLSKMSNDLRLLSSGPRSGLNEINLPEKQAGSSIMPGKINPVIPEVVNQVCFKVMGNDLCVSMAAEAGQLQLNAMEPVICQALFESIDLLKNAMNNLRIDCIQGITANEGICRDYVLSSIGIVTLLNPFIGHHHGDDVSKLCRLTGKSVRAIVLEKGLMTDTDLDNILSPENISRLSRLTQDPVS
ncbi:aspartate ammonia-lyase [Pantoea coffeiphila]|uniref:aspartate ammonia-lyase n=1 Tax=Pantoea coffeiphila TaxID=1465635 RepID=UPI00195FFDA6|nr:aspartate ammonia-lyase [Pantoea coffeiphila]MBM7345032.1 aspartate ammonia-lyase [Pantoea coffeiphila]